MSGRPRVRSEWRFHDGRARPPPCNRRRRGAGTHPHRAFLVAARAPPCAARTLGAYWYKRCVTERRRASLTRPTSGLEKAGRNASQGIKKMRYFVAPLRASRRASTSAPPPPRAVSRAQMSCRETPGNAPFDPCDCRPPACSAAPTIAPPSRRAGCPFGQCLAATKGKDNVWARPPAPLPACIENAFPYNLFRLTVGPQR
jgi:hypothetical protein